jgi:hypothetical protein
MKRIGFSMLLALASLIAGCTRESPVMPEAETVVVRAYLFAGEPVRDIRLSLTLPLGGGETEATPVNDATVSLVRNGVSYALAASGGDSGAYHYPGTDLNVLAGDAFQILIRYKDQKIEAETTVPAAPDSVTISSGTLVLSDSISFGPPAGGSGGRDSTEALTVAWKAEPGALYYVTVENIETDPDTIETFGPFGGGWMRRTVSAPSSEDRYRIGRSDLSFYGSHRVKVFRVNREYADLYGSRQQDSRDLNEPLTNIRNGLGIFSAFNSNVVYFDAVKK